MQTRLARSFSALRYDLSSQRARDNASKMLLEHDRLLAEIDALAVRLDNALPAAEPAPPAVEAPVEAPAVAEAPAQATAPARLEQQAQRVA